MDDAEIVELFWARDSEAIAAMEEKYGGYLNSLCISFLKSAEDAEECVSDTMMRLWETIPPQRPKSLRAYASKILRNLTIDHWRANKSLMRDAVFTELTVELEECLPVIPSPEKIYGDREIAAVIERWVKSLPRQDRVLFLRRYWYGDSVEELARRRGVPAGRLSQKLWRLRAGLKRELKKEGISI